MCQLSAIFQGDICTRGYLQSIMYTINRDFLQVIQGILTKKLQCCFSSKSWMRNSYMHLVLFFTELLHYSYGRAWTHGRSSLDHTANDLLLVQHCDGTPSINLFMGMEAIIHRGWCKYGSSTDATAQLKLKVVCSTWIPSLQVMHGTSMCSWLCLGL